MNKLTTVLLVLVTILLSGCLVSEKPLFPDGVWIAQTPLRSGYYLRYTTTRADGRAETQAQVTPIYLGLTGKTYTKFESKFQSAPKAQDFQLFASNNSTDFVVQALYDNGWSGSIWTYNRLSVEQGAVGFVRENCGIGEGSIDPFNKRLAIENGWIVKVTNTACYFNKSSHVMTTVEFPSNWSKATRDVYLPVDPKNVVTLQSLSDPPMLPVQCEGLQKNQELGAAFGAGSSISGPHLVVLASTQTPRTSYQRSLAVEANEGRYGTWAHLGMKDNATSQIFCDPELLIHVGAILPKQNAYDTARDVDRVMESCHSLTSRACGSLDQMIDRYRKMGKLILVQGYRTLRFPGTGTTVGELLTVMGQEGLSKDLAVLSTKRSGVTLVLIGDE